MIRPYNMRSSLAAFAAFCSLHSLLVTLFALIHQNSLVHAAPLPHYITDVPFGKKLVVSNRTVSCSGEIHGSKYPSLMYTCDNIKVDGQRLFHSYSISESGVSDVCAGCRCRPDYNHPNNILALCRAMIHSSGMDKNIAAAYVVKPSCSNRNPGELVKFIQVAENSTPYWTTVTTLSNIYITTLQCLTQS